MLLHDREELDDDLGGGAEKHLPLAALLGVEHVLEGIVEDADAHHDDEPAGRQQGRRGEGGAAAQRRAREQKEQPWRRAAAKFAPQPPHFHPYPLIHSSKSSSSLLASVYDAVIRLLTLRPISVLQPFSHCGS